MKKNENKQEEAGIGPFEKKKHDVKNLSLKVVRKIEISFVNKFWAVERLARPKVKKWAEPS